MTLLAVVSASAVAAAVAAFVGVVHEPFMRWCERVAATPSPTSLHTHTHTLGVCVFVCGWASALSAKAVNIREIYNAADDDDGPRRRTTATTATTTTTATAPRILAYESVSGALQSSSESNHRRPLDSTTRRQEGNTTPRVRDSHNAYRAANPPDFAADTDTISARYAAHSTANGRAQNSNRNPNRNPNRNRNCCAPLASHCCHTALSA